MSTSSRHAAARADAEAVAALRAGDEEAFVALVRAHHRALVGIAMTYGSSRAAAEEVVRETWLTVLERLDGFHGRTSLKAWIAEIAARVARARAGRRRPVSPVGGGALGAAAEPCVDPSRFHPEGHPHAGHWARPPLAWDIPEEARAAGDARAVVRDALAQLPPAQRLVVTLRDVEGWSAGEICAALAITAVAERALLHRGRSAVRAALERHMRPADRAA